MAKHTIRNTGGSAIPMGSVSIGIGAVFFFYDDVIGKTNALTNIRYSVSALPTGLAKSFRDGTALYQIDGVTQDVDAFYTLLFSLSVSTGLALPPHYGDVVFVVDNGDSDITSGQTDFVRIPYSGKLLDWCILADQTGSVVVDVWLGRDKAIPSVANTICSGPKPTLSNNNFSEMTTLPWSITSFDQDDVLGFQVVSVSGLKKFRLSIKTLRQL